MLSKDIISAVRTGKIGVIPTDTVYGLVCAADLPEAVKRLYGVKNRDTKPGTLIAANIDQLVDLGIPRRYLTAVEQFWPNPISVVVHAGNLPKETHLENGTIAVRIPKDEKLAKSLLKTGPLLTTSANQPGEVPATTIDQAKNYFKDELDFYVDGGDFSGRESSTIIRIIDDAVEVLRQGATKVNEKGEIENEV